MKCTLVLHANGPKPQDFNVYLSDDNPWPVSTRNPARQWWRVGMLQNVRFKARADNPIPEIQGGFLGVAVNEYPEPDLSEGLVITYLDFAMVGEKSLATPITVYIRNGEQVLGMIQEIDVQVDVKGDASVRLEAMDIVEWKDELPEWVELKLIPLPSGD